MTIVTMLSALWKQTAAAVLLPIALLGMTYRMRLETADVHKNVVPLCALQIYAFHAASSSTSYTQI